MNFLASSTRSCSFRVFRSPRGSTSASGFAANHFVFTQSGPNVFAQGQTGAVRVDGHFVAELVVARLRPVGRERIERPTIQAAAPGIEVTSADNSARVAHPPADLCGSTYVPA